MGSAWGELGSADDDAALGDRTPGFADRRSEPGRSRWSRCPGGSASGWRRVRVPILADEAGASGTSLARTIVFDPCLFRRPAAVALPGADRLRRLPGRALGTCFARLLVAALSVGTPTFRDPASVTDCATGFAFGSPTSAPSGGGSGARSRLGSSRAPISATTTIAATRATPRHLIRTPPIALQGPDRRDLSPYCRPRSQKTPHSAAKCERAGRAPRPRSDARRRASSTSPRGPPRCPPPGRRPSRRGCGRR